MKTYESNAYFWQKLDSLLSSSGFKIIRHPGDIHPDFSNLSYPTDYGYLNDTKSTSGEGISIYHGTAANGTINGVVVGVDILSKELDAKLIYECTKEEEEKVLHFLNQTNFMKTVLIRRDNEIPGWALTDD